MTTREEDRKIIRVDVDAFCTSIEQRDNPSLNGKPIILGSIGRRGLVLAASDEACRLGVRVGQPLTMAKQRSPDLILLNARHEIYRRVSADLQEILRDYSELVELVSLGGAFLDVTDDRQALKTAWITAQVIRARICRELGLTSSAGVSYNKFLANLAAGFRRPNRQFAIVPESGSAWVEALRVSDLDGVDPVNATKMQLLGIKTALDLRACTMPFLRKHFGRSAEWYYDISRGRDHRPVRPTITTSCDVRARAASPNWLSLAKFPLSPRRAGVHVDSP